MMPGYIAKLEKLALNQALKISELEARIAALELENTLLSLKGGEEDTSNRLGLAIVDPR